MPEQSTLFPVDELRPQGFRYWEHFLSQQEEAKLLEAVRLVDVHPMIFQGFEAKRKVKSFGFDYHFDSRTITEGQPIPEVFGFLLEKVSSHLQLPVQEMKELLVTEYPSGSVINWHRDASPFEVIVGISLLSDCNFRFRPYDKAKQGRKSIITYPVGRRSLYLLSGEARRDWEHSIAPVKETRYSLTIRTLRP